MSPLNPGWRFVVIVPFVVVSIIESAVVVISREVRWTPSVLLPVVPYMSLNDFMDICGSVLI